MPDDPQAGLETTATAASPTTEVAASPPATMPADATAPVGGTDATVEAAPGAVQDTDDFDFDALHQRYGDRLFDAAYERTVKDPNRAGRFGTRMQKSVEAAEQRGFQRGQTEADRRREAREREQALRALPPDQFKATVLQEQDTRQWVEQTQQAGYQQGAKETHDRWLNRITHGVPQETLSEFWTEHVLNNPDPTNPQMAEDAFAAAVVEWKSDHKAQLKAEEKAQKLLAAAQKEWEAKYESVQRQGQPVASLANGQPVGGSVRQFTYADEAEGAFSRREISYAELVDARNTLPYSYMQR